MRKPNFRILHADVCRLSQFSALQPLSRLAQCSQQLPLSALFLFCKTLSKFYFNFFHAFVFCPDLRSGFDGLVVGLLAVTYCTVRFLCTVNGTTHGMERNNTKYHGCQLFLISESSKWQTVLSRRYHRIQCGIANEVKMLVSWQPILRLLPFF